MSREVVISIWCDVCLDLDDLKIDGKEMAPVQIGATKARVLALCEEHEKTFFVPFQEALTNLGTTTDVLARAGERPKLGRPTAIPVPGEVPPLPASQAEAIICPVADCPAKPLANTSSLRSHIKNKHQSTLDELVENGATLYTPGGQPLAYRGHGHDSGPPPVLRAECDVKGCGVVYEYPENGRPSQALGVHRRMKHGITADGTVVEAKAKASA